MESEAATYWLLRDSPGMGLFQRVVDYGVVHCASAQLSKKNSYLTYL